MALRGPAVPLHVVLSHMVANFFKASRRPSCSSQLRWSYQMQCNRGSDYAIPFAVFCALEASVRFHPHLGEEEVLQGRNSLGVI